MGLKELGEKGEISVSWSSQDVSFRIRKIERLCQIEKVGRRHFAWGKRNEQICINEKEQSLCGDRKWNAWLEKVSLGNQWCRG